VTFEVFHGSYVQVMVFWVKKVVLSIDNKVLEKYVTNYCKFMRVFMKLTAVQQHKLFFLALH
jgi:hypothetical protein